MPSGRWAAQATVEDPETGRKIRKTWYGASESEARTRMHDALAEYRKGAPVSTGREPTLRSWTEEWLAGLQLRPKTMLRYRGCLALVLPALGDRPLSKITPTAVSQLLRQLHREGRKSRTCNRARDVLRNSLNEAVRQGKLARNAAALARPLPENDVEEMRTLRAADVGAFLAMAAEEPDGNLWVVSLALGLRLGEVQGLREEDVVNGRLQVQREIQWIEGRWVVQTPKSAKGKRTLVLPQIAAEALQCERSRQAGYRLAAGPSWPDTWSGYVFLAENGVPRNPSTVSYRMKAAMRKAGLEPIRFHDTRHTAGSLLVAAGVSIAEVSRQLGHSRKSTTLDYYTHAQDDGALVAATMNKLLGGAG